MWVGCTTPEPGGISFWKCIPLAGVPAGHQTDPIRVGPKADMVEQITNACCVNERGPRGGSFGPKAGGDQAVWDPVRSMNRFAFWMLEFECRPRHRPHPGAQLKDALRCLRIDLAAHLSSQTSTGRGQRRHLGSVTKERAKAIEHDLPETP